MSVLGDRLKELRGAMSQAEFARQMEIQRPQWIGYEQGKNIPSAAVIEKICRVNGCSADWLLGLSPVKQEQTDWKVRATIAERKLDKVKQMLSELQEAVK